MVGKVPEYSEETGPWTRIVFDSPTVHLGTLPDSSRLSFVQRGGESPNGRHLMLSHQTNFYVGERYVLFLRNTGWNISPIVGEYAFRVVKTSKKQQLVNAHGSVAVGFRSNGISLSAPIFSRRDLNGSPAVRLRSNPVEALNVDGLVASVESNLRVRGLSLSGPFFNEPFTRQRLLPTATPIDELLSIERRDP